MFNQYPDVLDVKQAAEALGICVNSVYRLIKERNLGCKRVGSKILIPKICLQQFLRSAQYTTVQS